MEEFQVDYNLIIRNRTNDTLEFKIITVYSCPESKISEFQDLYSEINSDSSSTYWRIKYYYKFSDNISMLPGDIRLFRGEEAYHSFIECPDMNYEFGFETIELKEHSQITNGWRQVHGGISREEFEMEIYYFNN